MNKILIIGATGSIGKHVVNQAIKRGVRTKALVRNLDSAREMLPAAAELIYGDATDPSVLVKAIENVDGIILTHSAHRPEAAIEAVDYGVVKNLLHMLAGRRVHIVLMTSFGVTATEQLQNQVLGILDWKRRSERLLRKSGQIYTIVRPGWFDYNEDNERSIVFLQGDPLRSGTPQAGRIARDQIARVLIDSLFTKGARYKTFELIAEHGKEQPELTESFNRLLSDTPNSIDGVLDPDTLPLRNEPTRVIEDIKFIAEVISPQQSLEDTHSVTKYTNNII
ncbi:SDR family oxidoreductase [Serratia rubidaea]|uniref:SDR family oxidoreductase n=1 Tax=Serratia rubidaea TaxID=61652 RepID=UPI00243155F6|nr:SDR family oxidoreductase [Serratia rubidaea]MCR1000654.1 SDR family oxidoreductase [Serratia rubidaea]